MVVNPNFCLKLFNHYCNIKTDIESRKKEENIKLFLFKYFVEECQNPKQMCQRKESSLLASSSDPRATGNSSAVALVIQ